MAAKKTTKTTASAPEKPAPAAKKTANKAAKKAAPPAAKVPAVKAPTAKKAAKTVQASAPVKPAPTPDEIARAAYLIYRSRVEKGLPGDSRGDWLEAERQLRA